ncbi:NAD(P)/FAD-dependent oxidoreductase [Nocardia sp. NPDC127526]|uniref:NAD(P)/FAD-dependent oxidoreductase n=1 Tax=Nocardia sp. NPDC127526 TaxID=3345393 RepID=UPI003629EF52
MIQHHIVVLGGGYAGMMCALRLDRRLRHRDDVHITLVNPSPRFTERLRTHQLAAGRRPEEYRIEDLLEPTAIEFICGTATVIDTETRMIAVETLGQKRHLDYDVLVYALGSIADTRAVPGAERYAHTLDSPQRAERLAHRLGELGAGATVTVCGGGLTGVEGAAEIAEAYPYLRVSLVSRGEPAAALGPRARGHVRAAFDRLGITVHDGSVTKVSPVAVELDGGEPLGSDVTVWTGGVRVPELAADSGIGTDERGLVTVDPTLRARTHPDIYAIGDAAAIRQRWGQLHGTCQSALPAGAHAADQIARELRGLEPKPFRFGYFHQPVSLGRRDAVIQYVHQDARPRRFVLTGSRAVRYKEYVSRRPVRTYRKVPGLLGLLAS